MKRLILILILICTGTAFLNADIYIKEKVHTNAYKLLGQDQPERTEYADHWVGENIFAHNTYTMANNQKVLKKGIIIDQNKQILLLINHTAKTYVRTNLPLETTRILPPETIQNLSTLKLTAKVTPNSQSERKGAWSCIGYDVAMLLTSTQNITLKMTVWSSTDIPLDWKTYQTQIFPTFKKASALQLPITEKVIEELKKIQGYPVQSTLVTTIGETTINQQTEVLQIEDLEAPTGIYDAPEDYREKKDLSRKDLMNQ